MYNGLPVIQPERIDAGSKGRVWDFTAATLRCDTPTDGEDAVNKDYCDSVAGGAVWGNITGVLGAQADLAAALGAKEPTIAAGLVTQWWRGDKTWVSLTTDDVSEGSNLYYTDVRARAGVTGMGLSSFTNNVGFITDLSSFTTTDLAEGINLYYTTARFDSRFATKTTTDLSEGSNLYFTDERAQDAVGNAVGTGLSYNDGTGAIACTITQYTDEMAEDAVGGTLTDTNDVDLAYDDALNQISATIPTTFITAKTADASPDAATDYVLTYDASAGALKKVLIQDMPAGSALPVVDTTAIVKGSADATKQMRFEVDGLTTGTTRVLTVQDSDGTIALTGNKLSAFAATSSAELAGVISDETGSGSLVFATSPVFTTPNIGNATGNISGNAATVTTNANLTGEITSIGNAAVLDKTAITNQAADATPDAATDYVLTYDASAAALKKVLIEDLPSGGTPGGADTQVQYNNAGVFGGDAGFTYNAATDTATIGNIIDSGLTANTALTANGSKQITSSATTATELGYVSGVTSAIQTQLDGKVSKSLYDANTVLAATVDDTPAAVTITEQTVLGRATGGNITALAIDSDLSAVSAANDTVPSAKAVYVALALKVNNTGDETIAGVKTFSSDPIIPDEAYGAGWNGSLEPPTKNAVYDKIQTMGGGGISLGLVTAVNMGCGGSFMGNY